MSDKLKVACISTDPRVAVNGWKKDSSTQVQKLVAALTSAGCEVHLFAANVDFSPAPALSDAIVHSLDGSPGGRRCLSHRRVSLASNQILKASLVEYGPFDLVYEWFTLCSTVGMQYANDHGIAGILHLNTDIVKKLKRYGKLVDEVTARQVTKRCFDNASALIADSHDVARFIETTYARSGKLHILPGGITAVIDALPDDRVCERTGTFTVGYVGNLDSRHPVDDLIRSFGKLHQQHKSSRLLIVGGGNGQQEAEELISARGLADVTTLTGPVASNEAQALKRHMDTIVVPVVPSLSHCSSTTRLLDHMASGAVIVAADCARTRFTIRDGVNGMLYEGGDSGQLTDTLARLHRFPRFARSLSENARQFVCEQHSSGSTTQKILEITHQDALREDNLGLSAGTGAP